MKITRRQLRKLIESIAHFKLRDFVLRAKQFDTREGKIIEFIEKEIGPTIGIGSNRRVFLLRDDPSKVLKVSIYYTSDRLDYNNYGQGNNSKLVKSVEEYPEFFPRIYDYDSEMLMVLVDKLIPFDEVDPRIKELVFKKNFSFISNLDSIFGKEVLGLLHEDMINIFGHVNFIYYLFDRIIDWDDYPIVDALDNVGVNESEIDRIVNRLFEIDPKVYRLKKYCEKFESYIADLTGDDNIGFDNLDDMNFKIIDVS